MSQPPRGVLFDLDGTLVDTNYLHVVAWWEAFQAAGHDVQMTDIHRCIGMGADVLISELLGSGDAAAEEGHQERFARFYPAIRPFPRAADLLRAVAGRGLRVVLASSGSAEDVATFRKVLDVEDAVHTVTGSADAEGAKPEPDILQAALDRAGLSAENAVMVGDARWDVEASARAGLPCVSLLTGGISRAELTEAGAVAVYRDTADLLDHLDDSPIGRLAEAAGSH